MHKYFFKEINYRTQKNIRECDLIKHKIEDHEESENELICEPGTNWIDREALAKQINDYVNEDMVYF